MKIELHSMVLKAATDGNFPSVGPACPTTAKISLAAVLRPEQAACVIPI